MEILVYNVHTEAVSCLIIQEALNESLSTIQMWVFIQCVQCFMRPCSRSVFVMFKLLTSRRITMMFSGIGLQIGCSLYDVSHFYVHTLFQ